MTSSTSRSFLDDLGSAVQANPVPAALIGMGALWMLMGGGRTTAAAALLANGASRAGDMLAPVGTALKSGTSKIGETVSGIATAASDAVGQAAGTAGEAITEAAGRVATSAAETGKQVGAQSSAATGSAANLIGNVQGNLAETFERQPLLVGAIGLAIGAALATAFPVTRTEQEMVGDQAAAVKRNVEEFVSEQAGNLGDVANRTLEAVKDEAAAQGLTPAGLKQGAQTIRDKAMEVATSARGKSQGRNGSQGSSRQG